MTVRLGGVGVTFLKYLWPTVNKRLKMSVPEKDRGGRTA